MKIAIIGAGPVGLYFAGLCQDHQIEYTLYESTPEVGGQITQLYPKKEIINIPGINSIVAEDYIKQLYQKLDPKKLEVGHKIKDLFEVSWADKVIIATGKGEFTPRKLTEFSSTFEQDTCNIKYYLNDYSFLADKKVVIFGGGDSALDWAKQLSEICQVTLVHRRPEFRGNSATIAGCDNLTILKPFVLKMIDVSKFQKTVTVETAPMYSTNGVQEVTLDYDYILVNFGYELKECDFITDNKTVYKIGDCTGTTTIADGIDQANKLFKEIING